MDEKAEDKSAESRQNHIEYYKSLGRILASTKKELDSETGSMHAEHLQNRIDAINKDKQRIREMFPDMAWESVD